MTHVPLAGTEAGTGVNLHVEKSPAEARAGRFRSIEAASVAERHARLAGIVLYCCALLCFAGTDTSAKWLSRSLPVLEVVWARYFISGVIVFGVANPWTRPGIFRTNRPGLQALRSLLLLGSTAGAFLALRSLQLAEATSIGFSQPLLIALFAGPFLGEWVGPRRLVAICVGFLGVLVVTKPGPGTFQPAVLYSLAGVACNSFYYITTRKLAATDRPQTTMAYTSLAGIIVLTPLLPWIWVTPATPAAWFLMVTMGFFGALSQWLIVLAHHRAPAAVLAPFGYIQITWTTALGFFIFGDVPDLYTLFGGAIVIGSGLYLWHRERAKRGEP